MNLLVLGRGKTGSLVAQIAGEHGHRVQTLGSTDNLHAKALTPRFVSDHDVVIDFTNPEATLENMRRCTELHKSMVVGTTGWFAALPEIKDLVQSSGTTLVWGGNFSIGVNLFYEIVRTAAEAAHHGYDISIRETHHIHKRDAPSGTAVALRNRVGADTPIESVREGENMGRHEVLLRSEVDEITLIHQAHSRRGFALGAVKAAEWIATNRHPGCYEFSEIFRDLP